VRGIPARSRLSPESPNAANSQKDGEQQDGNPGLNQIKMQRVTCDEQCGDEPR
jgi:hypothetical protein